MQLMRFVRWVMYGYGVYNLVVGILSIIDAPLVAQLYAVNGPAPVLLAATRWIGALALTLSYAAFWAARDLSRPLQGMLLIASAGSEVAGIWGLVAGEIGWATAGSDMVAQAVVLIALFISYLTRERPAV